MECLRFAILFRLLSSLPAWVAHRCSMSAFASIADDSPSAISRSVPLHGTFKTSHVVGEFLLFRIYRCIRVAIFRRVFSGRAEKAVC